MFISYFNSFGSVPDLLDLDDFSDKENGSVSPKSNSNNQLLIDHAESTGMESYEKIGFLNDQSPQIF